MARKKMDREERMEYKGGKYMGGPAEERAEKKKKTKRMALGGTAGGGRNRAREAWDRNVAESRARNSIPFADRIQEARDMVERARRNLYERAGIPYAPLSSRNAFQRVTPKKKGAPVGNAVMAPPQLGGGQVSTAPQTPAVATSSQAAAPQAMDTSSVAPEQDFAPQEEASAAMRKGGMVRGAGCATRGIGRALSMNISAKGRSKGKK